MADLGVLSGGLGIVSLAIQVSDSMMKLKSFLNRIKDAPDEIKYTIKQIETMNLVLSSHDPNDDDHDSCKAASTARRACRMFLVEAAGQVKTIVTDLEVAIGKRRKMGSLKTVLKQDMIERLKQRLKDAQDLLLLSNQYYSQVLEKRRFDMERQWADMQVHKLGDLEESISQCTRVMRVIAQHTESLPSPSMKPNVSETCHLQSNFMDPDGSIHARDYNSSSLKLRKRTYTQKKLPSWLSWRLYGLEICTRRGLYGMSLDLKMYRFVDYDSPIMKCAREGNISSIQNLFSKRLATPNDRLGVNDLSVLDVAARHCQVEVCRLLIDCGAHGDARIAYQQALSYGNPLQDPKRRVDLLRTLTNAVDDDDFFDLEAPKSAVNYFWGDAATLSWILNNVTGYTFRTSTLEDRTRLAIFLCSRLIQPRAASLVRCLLPAPEDIISMCKYKDLRRATLLHGCGWALGEQTLRVTQTRLLRPRSFCKSRVHDFRDRFDYNAKAESDCLQDLLLLMKELIVAGSDLHACAQRAWNVSSKYRPECVAETPLSTIISGFSHLSELCLYNKIDFRGEHGEKYIPVPMVTDLCIPIKLWLQLLYDAGVDLVKYGRKEKLLRLQGQTSAQCRFVVWRRAISRFCATLAHNWRQVEKIFSISFTYGPKPSDWNFCFIEEIDESFADFWDMVEHPERTMPGAWDESEDADFERYLQRTRRLKEDCGQ